MTAHTSRLDKIVIVDDDARIRDLLRRFLSPEGFDVLLAEDGRALDRILQRETIDLIVLDLMLPGEDGLSICKRLRSTGTKTPVIMLTARTELADRLQGFASGADDYLVKPFEPKELLLRINAILRRVPVVQPAAAVPKVLHMGTVRYDMDRGELWRGNDLIRLTSTEAALMRVFSAQPGVAISRDKLVGDATDEGGQERAVDVQITRLRRKIEDDPKQPRYLQTVRGEGYMLQPD